MKALADAGIRSEQLSRPVPTTHILRGLKSQHAEQMGIEPNTYGWANVVPLPIWVGAIEGQVTITIGTSRRSSHSPPTPIH